MSNLRRNVYIVITLIAVLAACSDPPRQAPAAPPEGLASSPVDGQMAFFRMFVAARGWASDAQGLRMEPLHLPEVPPDGGAFGAWRASFVSPGKRRTAFFNYSVIDAGGKLPKGVFQDHEEEYSEGRTRPWPGIALKIGSQKALEVALEHEKTKAYVKQNPDEPITFLLELTKRHPNLTWRVIWGDSISTSGFSVFVDASTGALVEVAR